MIFLSGCVSSDWDDYHGQLLGMQDRPVEPINPYGWSMYLPVPLHIGPSDQDEQLSVAPEIHLYSGFLHGRHRDHQQRVPSVRVLGETPLPTCCWVTTPNRKKAIRLKCLCLTGTRRSTGKTMSSVQKLQEMLLPPGEYTHYRSVDPNRLVYLSVGSNGRMRPARSWNKDR